jgi:hypothetical protein
MVPSTAATAHAPHWVILAIADLLAQVEAIYNPHAIGYVTDRPE